MFSKLNIDKFQIGIFMLAVIVKKRVRSFGTIYLNRPFYLTTKRQKDRNIIL